MSRYEDLEGTGDFPGAGRKRLGSMLRRRGHDGDDAWDGDGGRARGGRLRAAGQGQAGPGRSARSGVSRSHRILGRHPLLSVLGILATLTLTFISLTAYAAYRNVYDSIHHLTVSPSMLGHRPPKLNGSTNILIIGSDSRNGTHGKFGHGIQGSRSDTSMLLHISPTHTGAIVVSFPRDTMVPILPCEGDGDGHPGQQAQPGVVEPLNSAFSYGGAPCLWKTIEQTSHVHIDHFVEVDFAGFMKIVNDLGGVSVCLPYAIHDPASRLNLPRGLHTVNGAQALAFVRERHIGEGSDLQRIQRQQLFLASVAQKIKQSSSVTDPAKLYSLVHDIASSLTTDSGLSPTEMYAIANSMKSLSTSALQFIQVPVVPYPLNPGGQVEYWQPYADQLFHAISRDNRILKVAKRAPKPSSSVPTVSTDKVHVQVLNGTSVSGLAATTAGQLSARGFKVAGTGNASVSSSTVIEYGTASQVAAANTLQKEISGAQIKQVSSVKSSSLNLVLGSGFKGLTSSHKAKKTKASVSKVVKSIGTGISGNTNICKDSSAFTGPDTPSMFPNG